jgi:hypothetical protein
VVNLEGIPFSMSTSSLVQTRKSLVFRLPLFVLVFGDSFYVTVLFTQNSFYPFLLVFFKVGIGNFYLGITWSGPPLCGLVHSFFGIEMDSSDWKEARKIFRRHEEITQVNNNPSAYFFEAFRPGVG